MWPVKINALPLQAHQLTLACSGAECHLHQQIEPWEVTFRSDAHGAAEDRQFVMPFSSY